MNNTIDVIKSSFTADEISLAIKEELVYLQSSMAKIFVDIKELSELIISSEQMLSNFYKQYRQDLEPLFIQAGNIAIKENKPDLLNNIIININGKDFPANYFNPANLANLFITNVDMNKLKQDYDNIIIACNPETGKCNVDKKIIYIIQLAYNNRFEIIIRRFVEMFAEYSNKDLTKEENQMLYLTYQHNIMIDLLNILRSRMDFLSECNLAEINSLAEINNQEEGSLSLQIITKMNQALQDYVTIKESVVK